MAVVSGPHPSHELRGSDASTFDVICTKCGRHDQVPGGWGLLEQPCPNELDRWPKTVKYYLHGSKEGNRDIGEEIGLSDEAIREVFRGCCYEVELTLLVDEDGRAWAHQINGMDIPKIEVT